jgi:anhydro-N-acetylmuramic acid kinase
MTQSPLDILTSLALKDSRLICGVMSGTSVDAVDVAIVRVGGGGLGTTLELVQYTETLFPEEVQQLVFSNSDVSSSNVYDICLLHAALAHTYAESVRQACEEAGIDVRSLDLVGVHGQTMHHIPEPAQLGRHLVRSTLQIGSGPTMAALLGVPVLTDFRAADMAVGGQGAPLVPYADYLLFRSPDEHRLLLNIGGIANLTWLPADCVADDVAAFDSGPGNMVVDALARQFFGKEFDEGGAIARTGRVNPDLLSWMLGHPYFRRTPPKSTGRETFGSEFVGTYLQIARDLEIETPADLIATAAECTVRTASTAISQLTHGCSDYALYVGGGGAKNLFFTEGLRFSLPNAQLKPFDVCGIQADAKEAVCFAVLANEWLHGNPTNLPRVTGASRRVILGSLSVV